MIELVQSPAYLDGYSSNEFRALIPTFPDLKFVFWGLSEKYHDEPERALFNKQITTYNEGIHQGFTITHTLPDGEYHILCTAISKRGKVSFKNGLMIKVPKGFIAPKAKDPELALIEELARKARREQL